MMAQMKINATKRARFPNFILPYYLITFRQGLFYTKDMQTAPPFRSGHICMKDSHSAESNESSIFQFFRFPFFRYD